MKEDKTWYARPNKVQFSKVGASFNADDWIMPHDLHDSFWGYKNSGTSNVKGVISFDDEDDYEEEDDV